MNTTIAAMPPSFLFLLLGPLHAQESPQDFPSLVGPYLGQPPPGRTAELFAFDVFDPIYRSFHSSVVFSPDGHHAYWQTGLDDGSRLQGIFESRYEDGRWTRPHVAFFSSLTTTGVDDAPFISPDGNRFFFLSCRPVDGGDGCKKWNIWVMERTQQGRSAPRVLPPAVNSLEGIHWQLSVDRKGDLYFGTWKSLGDDKYTGEIHMCEYADGSYAQPRKLRPDINVPGRYTRSPFIAPDGSYLLFNRNDETTTARLFISFRIREGVWTKPRDLSEILGRQAWNPIVTPDGQFLFFLATERGKIRPFWIGTGFIDELREMELGTSSLRPQRLRRRDPARTASRQQNRERCHAQEH